MLVSPSRRTKFQCLAAGKDLSRGNFDLNFSQLLSSSQVTPQMSGEGYQKPVNGWWICFQGKLCTSAEDERVRAPQRNCGLHRWKGKGVPRLPELAKSRGVLEF